MHTPLCRLESIIRSLSMKKLSKPVILVRPKLELKFQPQFSDLSLVSEEGESIPCHRCVLVARSGTLLCLNKYTYLLNFDLCTYFFRIFPKYVAYGMERGESQAVLVSGCTAECGH